jgi:hypothetical protein
MTTFDLAEVRGFAADLDARMDRCDNGEGTECARLDAALRHYVELCCEFREGVREWWREVFSGRVEFDPEVEQAWQDGSWPFADSYVGRLLQDDPPTDAEHVLPGLGRSRSGRQACWVWHLRSTNEPWNVREMHIRYSDGHVFRISREAGEAGPWEFASASATCHGSIFRQVHQETEVGVDGHIELVQSETATGKQAMPR